MLRITKYSIVAAADKSISCYILELLTGLTSQIMVTEAGTEAAAYSIASISRMGGTSTTITFSHPFVFVIYDSCNNLILFQGRVVDPQ